MTFPLLVLLIPYLLFLALWLAFSIVAIYHMLKYGFKNFTTLLTTFIYIIVATIMLLIVIYLLGQINWQKPVTIFENSINFNPSLPLK